MRNRTIIRNVKPALDGGKYFITRVPEETVDVSAEIIADGNDVIKASLLFKEKKARKWNEVPMSAREDDRFEGCFTVKKEGFYVYKIEAWTDKLATWHKRFMGKRKAGRPLADELLNGAYLLRAAAEKSLKSIARKLIIWAKQLEDKAHYHEAVNLVASEEFSDTIGTCSLKKHMTVFDESQVVRVGHAHDMFSTWYQMFPRSASPVPGQHGTFKDCEKLLPRIAGMGFDVLLLPPIHPIGTTNRKGPNNTIAAGPDDPGSPWSVGNEEGGHKAVNPQLGTLEDFEYFVKAAAKQGLQVALDMGLRCSPDHPYVKDHPAWFERLPDGRLATDEEPPLNYLDIANFDFECDDWRSLWDELKSIVLFWAEKGVRFFYASAPHLKPFAFWQWLITEVQKVHPDTVLLSGALGRVKVINELAKTGFTQSLTYFIWQNTKKELQNYLTQLTKGETKEYLHPNFFTNTPDILPVSLAGAGESASMLRYALAATLSSNCGIYGPAFELMKNQRYPESRERYLNSEKFEIKNYDWNHRNKLMGFISKLNAQRKAQTALQYTFNLTFTNTDNDHIISYIKVSPDGKNRIWCIVNLDPQHKQSGYVEIPKEALGLKRWVNLKLEDLLTGETYHWFNDWNYVELRPQEYPLHLFKVEL
ncbi:MAG: maltotransferase domain-containing protein [Saprospiraceae bacterium]